MPASRDWLPNKNSELLVMADVWVSCIPVSNPPWGITSEVAQDLKTAHHSFKDRMSVPRNERTLAMNAEFRVFRRQLTHIMRNIKRRFLFMPPMNAFEYSIMMLKQRDTEPTPIDTPLLQPTGEINSSRNGIMEVGSIKPAGGVTPTKAEYGVSIHYGVLGSEWQYGISKVPSDGDELLHNVFTRKKKHLFNFQKDKGKQLFICMRYENSKGKRGPWGEVLSSFIS